MQLSPHFSLEEMTASESAARFHLANDPPPEVLDRLRIVAQRMEQIRTTLGHPITVTSGYRSPAVNAKVGGAKTSAHVLGWAVDFKCPGFGSPLAICRELQHSAIPYDQLIHEFGVWCHISFDPKGRHETLTIDKKGTRSGLLPVRP